MERVSSLFCVFVGCFFAAQSVQTEDSTVLEFSKFFEGLAPFPLERDFVPIPYDTIFSSWPKQTPDFHLLDKWPSILDFPRVEVFCDHARLTVLVGKVLGSIILTEGEVQLGDGCYRTVELPNQFVFIYNLNECGTSREVKNGLEIFTNSLHINDFRNALWTSPSTVDISCTPSRSDENTNLVGPQAPPEYGTRPYFDMRAVNSLWTASAESNVYKRGQIINLQVSANTRPEQELFIRSCFVSASPEPYTEPWHTVIMNKGCAAWFGSPRSSAHFLASHRADVVNFALNTSELISEPYVHCGVFLSDHGVTFDSKSCSYAIEARWQELSGASEVCDCCCAKCKGLPVKISEDAKSIVRAGPFVIIDQDLDEETSHPDSETLPTAEAPDSMRPDDPESVDPIVSGESLSTGEVSPPSPSLVVVRQEPGARLTLWHSGQAGNEKPEEMSSVFHNVPEHQPSTTDEELFQETPTKVINGNGLKVLSLAVIPLHLEEEVIEDSVMKTGLARQVKARRDLSAQPDGTIDAEGQDVVGLRKDELPPRLDANNNNNNNNGAVIRSKLQFTKAADGTRTLSFEEEMVKPEDRHAAPGRGRKMHRELRKGRMLRSTFLDFFRRMAGAE